MTVAATALSRRSGISFEDFYDELVSRGYEPEKIRGEGFDSTGYWEFEDGINPETQLRNRVWKEWKHRADWEFVDANYPGVGGWTYE